MIVVYHPDVQKDVSSILRHYDRIDPSLGDEFWAELNVFIAQAAANPGHFHFELPGRRRVIFADFPITSCFEKSPEVFASPWCAVTNKIQNVASRGARWWLTNPSPCSPSETFPRGAGPY
jgi:hypothetical protein